MVPPRAYDAPRRRAATETTRLRILEAARALVGGPGDLRDFSIDAVAERAAVARMTVYNQFESRARLLEALADHLAQRGGMERMRTVFTAASLDEGVRELVQTFVGFWAADRVTVRRLRAMGVVFPSVSAAGIDRDQWRRQAVAGLLERHGFRAKGRKGAATDELVDVLTALTSFEAFDQLCTASRKPEATIGLITSLALGAIRRYQ